MKRPLLSGWICVVALLFSAQTFAQSAKQGRGVGPIITIGASFANGATPFNDGFNAPLFGVAVGDGAYLSLGDALIRSRLHTGHVINEGQGGATTDTRPSCREALYGPGCSSAVFDSYAVQLQRGLARATNILTQQVSAKYVIITLANDCLHSDAFGVPEAQATPCTEAQMKASIDRFIQAGQAATAAGLTPVYGKYPDVTDLDLATFQASSLLKWTISEADYTKYRQLHESRIKAALPNALYLDYWSRFQHRGDGIHPDRKTVRRAALKIMLALHRHNRKQCNQASNTP